MQGTLAPEHVSTKGMSAYEHVSTQGTLARENVSMQGILAHEHVSNMYGTQFNRLQTLSTSLFLALPCNNSKGFYQANAPNDQQIWLMYFSQLSP